MNEIKYGLLIGILSNHGISAAKAWTLPSVLKDRIKELDSNLNSLSQLDCLSVEQVIGLYNQSPKLHRFNNKMAIYAHQLIEVVNAQYHADFDLLLPTDDNNRLISNVSSLPGMSLKKARHLLVYLVQIDNRYQITDEQYKLFTADCPQLVEKFDANLDILYRCQQSNSN